MHRSSRRSRGWPTRVPGLPRKPRRQSGYPQSSTAIPSLPTCLSAQYPNSLGTGPPHRRCPPPARSTKQPPGNIIIIVTSLPVFRCRETFIDCDKLHVLLPPECDDRGTFAEPEPRPYHLLWPQATRNRDPRHRQRDPTSSSKPRPFTAAVFVLPFVRFLRTTRRILTHTHAGTRHT
jgi:hypothetical protein